MVVASEADANARNRPHVQQKDLIAHSASYSIRTGPTLNSVVGAAGLTLHQSTKSIPELTSIAIVLPADSEGRSPETSIIVDHTFHILSFRRAAVTSNKKLLVVRNPESPMTGCPIAVPFV